MARNLEEERIALVSQIKNRYRLLYGTVNPDPRNHKYFRNVQDVFVAGNIEIFVAELPSEEAEWKPIDSIVNVLEDHELIDRPSIIEGDPGHGKSMLAMKIVDDWSDSPIHNSRLDDVDILVYLQMRDLMKVKSIHEAIKKFLLPSASSLSVSDVKRIISKCKLVMIIIDGYEDYSDRETISSLLQDIKIESSIIQEFIMTRTSVLPRDASTSEAVRIRLTCFDGLAQEKYLRKVVVGHHDKEVQRITASLNYELQSFQELCKVPMFYAVFSHLAAHGKRRLRTLDSVSGFFRCLMECLQSHLKRKGEDVLSSFTITETTDRALGKAAFSCLYDGEPEDGRFHLDSLQGEVGERPIGHYLRLGVLMRDNSSDNAKVKFSHQLFLEWYAAQFLAWVLAQPRDSELCSQYHVSDTDELLDNMRPIDAPYMLLFMCGMSPTAAKFVIRWLGFIGDYRTFSVLCHLEQNGSTQLERLEDMCSEAYEVGVYHRPLMHESSIKVLVLAADYKIPIKELVIRGCYKSIDREKEEMVFTTGHRIPILSNVVELYIEQRKRVFNQEEYHDLIDFTSKCQNLKMLVMENCVLPRSCDLDKLDIFQSRGVTLDWCAISVWHRLDLSTGKWKQRETGKAPDYDREVTTFISHYSWDTAGYVDPEYDW